MFKAITSVDTMTLSELRGRDEILQEQGWCKHNLGQYKSSGNIKDKNGFDVYVRRRNLSECIVDFSEKSTNTDSWNTHKTKPLEAGSNASMGSPECKLTPISSLPVLSSFGNYPSLKAICSDKPCILIGFDSEWENCGGDLRDMLSWQFSLVDGVDLLEVVILKTGDKNLSVYDALSFLLDLIGKYKPIDARLIRRYKYCPEWVDDEPVIVDTDNLDEARIQCKYVYRPGEGFTKERIEEMPDRYLKRSERDWAYFHSYLDFSKVESVKVTLVCHAGIVDLSTLEYGDKFLLKYLTEVQGGLVSLQPVKYTVKSSLSVNGQYLYPISLSISDTMCHAPSKKRSLKNLGKAIKVNKVEIDSDLKTHMVGLLKEDPVLFFEYAATDSVVTVLYSSALYGYNRTPPITITSITAYVMRSIMMDYLQCANTTEFNRKYRGLECVKKGKIKIPDRPGFVEATNLEPITNDANVIQLYASNAYHGGYNSCSEVGYFPYITFDYDIKNAYPTAMCLVPDIDWENPILNEIIRREMSLSDFVGVGGINPIAPFVGYVRFEFPDSCKYPCIPVNVDGVPVYPLSSEGLDGVYVAGPYIYLALKLGAKIYCDRGYFLRPLFNEETGHESRSLSAAVKQLVTDRNTAKMISGKGSLEELILKVMVNSGYGKNAQNVIEKHTWSAYKDLMEDLGCSCITNPVSAMMITSIIQVILIAAQNQIHDIGYMSCSVTTDGFISNCPLGTLNELDLYGFSPFIQSARIFLTDGDPSIWEIKHVQDDLVNFCTRGNVSLHDSDNADDNYISVNPMIWGDKKYPGVCAHNSTVSGFVPDTYEDRKWLMTQVVSRKSRITTVKEKWSSLKDVVHNRKFTVSKETRHISMDFDMKRKPDRGSFKRDSVVIEGTEYQIAHFDTVPFKTVSEFRLYRLKKELCSVLRTIEDWDLFWMKVDLSATGAHPRDLDWAILNSCIMGYRMGLWSIPALEGKTVEEKCVWINSHNTSRKRFKPTDWKNARRPERQVNMLPREIIEAKLKELTES